MFTRWFSKTPDTPKIEKPSIMGLAIGIGFDVDTLGFRLIMEQLVIEDIAATQAIVAAGKTNMDGNTLFRFYTQDDAWLQIVCQDGETENDIIDVKLFHYYDTLSIDSQADWDTLINEKIGTPTYTLEGREFTRVWSSVGDYAMPVALCETTYDDTEQTRKTDQFTMLFERRIDDHNMEFLFLSAEEAYNDQRNLERCLVISTGVNLSPAQIKVNG